MKRLLNFFLFFIILISLCACNDSKSKVESVSKTNNDKTSNASQTTIDTTGSTDNADVDSTSKTYTYQVRAMQGVEECVYYGPDANVPNSPNPESARNKIHVWTKCTTCGSNGETYHFVIHVEELDFSNGDKIQYTGTDSCWNCYWNNGLESFMWMIEISRIEQG